MSNATETFTDTETGEVRTLADINAEPTILDACEKINDIKVQVVTEVIIPVVEAQHNGFVFSEKGKLVGVTKVEDGGITTSLSVEWNNKFPDPFEMVEQMMFSTRLNALIGAMTI